jgi:hypothetical protein
MRPLKNVAEEAQHIAQSTFYIVGVQMSYWPYAKAVRSLRRLGHARWLIYHHCDGFFAMACYAGEPQASDSVEVAEVRGLVGCKSRLGLKWIQIRPTLLTETG